MPTLKVSPSKISAGGTVLINLVEPTENQKYTIRVVNDAIDLNATLFDGARGSDTHLIEEPFNTAGYPIGDYNVVVEGNDLNDNIAFSIIEGSTKVTLKSETTPYTKDQIIWVAIRKGAKNASYVGFEDFVRNKLCAAPNANIPIINATLSPIREGANSYAWQHTYPFIKAAATLYLEQSKLEDAFDQPFVSEEMRRLGDPNITTGQLMLDLKDHLQQIVGSDGLTLPYLNGVIERVVSNLVNITASSRTNCPTWSFIKHRLESPPMYDLIWNYWMSLAGLTETMNAVVDCYRRKSNERTALLSDVRFDLLRPIGNLLSGYARDTEIPITHEEYLVELQAQYGLVLPEHAGLDIQPTQTDTSFLGALHNVIGGSGKLLRDRLNKTLSIDTHSLGRTLGNMNVRLAMGAHNQLWEVTRRIRRDMLVQQWILSRPEVTEFLRVPAMVDMKEGWMSALAAYRDRKNQQSWSTARSGNYGNVSGNSSQSALVVQQFHRLACKSEIMVLGARWGGWSDEDLVGKSAEGWLNEVQHDIKDYISDYREVTRLVNLDVETADPQALALREMQPLQFLGSQAGGNAARQLMNRAAPQLTSQPQVKLLQRRMANRQERSGVLKRLPVFKITD